MNANPSEKMPFLDRPLHTLFKLNVETVIIIILIILAGITRFYNVDQRVMSHDETNHVVPAYDFYEGKGYRHDPVTHGPLKFHLVALSYFMLGDSDFSSRLPDVLFSIAAVAFVALAFRRYLGRIGALIASLLFLISPFMLFYGRYMRDEAFVVLFELIILYAVLRYLEKGEKLSLYILTVGLVLNFCSEETAFIFTAELLLFLAVVFIERLSRLDWGIEAARMKRLFLGLMSLALMTMLGALALGAYNASAFKATDTTGAAAAAGSAATTNLSQPTVIGMYALLGMAVICGIASAWIIIRSLGWKEIRSERTFDLLMLVGTLILPLLVAFPIQLFHLDPLDYSNAGLVRSGIFLIVIVIISAALGLWWKGKFWVTNAVIFYAIFTVFYTTFFTNGQGFFTGLIGSLGYWLSQQGVQRGSQPMYYYALIPIPVYEYLAAIGTIMALVIGVVYHKFSAIPGFWVSKDNEIEESHAETGVETNGVHNPYVPTLGMLIFFSVTALLAYSIAGEKMPWLTVYIILTMLLAAGWAFGFVIENVPWSKIANMRGVSVLLLLVVFVASFGVLIYSLITPTALPFQGSTLPQLEATNGFILTILAFVLSFGGVIYLVSSWYPKEIISLVGVAILAGLAILTARAAYVASYINYDTAKEYLVYAHSARGPKDILAQVEEISQRTTMGKDIVVAHDNDALYPFWWYLRDYPNKKWFNDKPANDLKEAAVIISGDSTMNKMAPIVKNNFIEYDYMRLWWPNQDYYDLTTQRLWDAISNPQLRAGIFNIWLNRDYTLYAQATNNANLKLDTWQPSSRMKMYIRKDIAAKIWNYGSLPVAQQPATVDPYQGKVAKLSSDLVVGAAGSAPGQFQAPRGMAVAADGSVYAADSRNNRIQHFNAQGELLDIWGTFADISKGAAPGGTFNEPWGVAVDSGGNVYVTDTWNHRVEKFNAKGEFIKMWGTFGQGETPTAFWGPRGIAVDNEGKVYVTDTGNKRIVIFNSDGLFVAQFGTAGVDAGQFDEPVGVAVDKSGKVYVNDTWNQRVQVFEAGADKVTYASVKQWTINGWFGQSLDNKPFIAVEASGNVLVTDPEGYRVLEFDANGTILRGWGDYSPDVDGFGLASGVAVAADGKVWVSDGANNRIMRFTLP